MLTFSINTQNTEAYILKVNRAIEENIQYFKKFNGEHWQEAVQQTYIQAIQSRDDKYEDVTPYIKALARTILLNDDPEKPYSITNEEGEVNYPYLDLKREIETDIYVDNEEVNRKFKELYLLYKDDFVKLKTLYKMNETYEKGIKINRSDVIKNPFIKKEIEELSLKFGARNIFYILFEFLKRLDKYTNIADNSTLRTLEMKDRELDLSVIPDIPMIKSHDGNYIGIDKNTLLMDTNPDFIKWDVISSTSCDIMRLDISPLMDYMYEQIFVPQGVNTRHIEWCDDVYKVTTPGGKSFVGLERHKFMNNVRIELIANLIQARYSTIIALSPDSVYLKPARTLMLHTLRLSFINGKQLDLPVTVHIKKR